MTYRYRDERPGLHHVVARGNNKQDIFIDDRDRVEFMRQLNRIATKHRWTIYAYCLMRNHYHLVIAAEGGGLGRAMCELNTSYATSFNTTHGRINHLFGKRYWNEFLPDDRRVMNTVRYVVRNPQRAGVAGSFQSYVWSSYAATIGLVLAFGRLAVGEVLALFGRTPAEAIREFGAFCEDDGSEERGGRQPP